MGIRLNNKSAELVGILLGDGSFYIGRNNHEVDIALDTKDARYIRYVMNLVKETTGTYVWEKYVKNVNCVHIRISRKEPTLELLKISLKKPGNKIENSVGIPAWIWENKKFLSLCLRGLIDTDGSIYRLKPHWPNLFQLSFKNNNKRLLKEAREAFVVLGFHPSKVFGNRIAVTRQAEVKKYFATVGSKNDTHLKEYAALLNINSK